MTKEELKYANELDDCLEQLQNLKRQFVEQTFPSVNNWSSTRLTPEVLNLWKSANITVLDQCIEQIQKDFEEL